MFTQLVSEDESTIIFNERLQKAKKKKQHKHEQKEKNWLVLRNRIERQRSKIEREVVEVA